MSARHWDLNWAAGTFRMGCSWEYDHIIMATLEKQGLDESDGGQTGIRLRLSMTESS
jgi:hypothetical protein